jgi:hypothetical protein
MVAVVCVVAAAGTGVCETGGVLSAGQQIRFAGAGGVPIEATVVSCRGDTVVFAYATEAYPPRAADADTLLLTSLQSLEVRLEPVPAVKGVLIGAVTGALIGAFVGFGTQELARSGDELDVLFIPAAGALAGFGAVLGATVGALIAHDRDTNWKRIPLSHE